MNLCAAIVTGIAISAIFIIAAMRINIFEHISHAFRMRKYRIQKSAEAANEQKIALMDPRLPNPGDLESYIALYRHRLPGEKEWDMLLPEMLRELLLTGWDAGMTIYTNRKYGRYEIYIKTEDKALKKRIDDIVKKYIEIFES